MEAVGLHTGKGPKQAVSAGKKQTHPMKRIRYCVSRPLPDLLKICLPTTSNGGCCSKMGCWLWEPMHWVAPKSITVLTFT